MARWREKETGKQAGDWKVEEGKWTAKTYGI